MAKTKSAKPKTQKKSTKPKGTKKRPSAKKIAKGEIYARQSAEQIVALKDNVAAFRKQISEMRTLARKRAARINQGYTETRELFDAVGNVTGTQTVKVKPYSYALDKYQQAKKNRGKQKAVTKMNYLELVSEWRRLSAFLTSETSTITGIRDVNYRQDSLIFGNSKYKNGKPVGTPLGTMTEEEREVFWALYESFKSGKDNFYGRLTSNQVITQLGAIMNDREAKTFRQLIQEQAARPAKERELLEAFNFAKARLQGVKEEEAERRAEEEYDDEREVYGGYGPNLPF